MVPKPYLAQPSWLDAHRTFHEGEGWKQADAYVQPVLDKLRDLGAGAFDQVFNKHPLLYGLGGGGLLAGGVAVHELMNAKPVSPAEQRRRRLAALVEAEAMGKQSSYEIPLGLGLLGGTMAGGLGGRMVGGAAGGANAPKGRRLEGVGRGVLYGGNIGSLGVGGGLAGGLAGDALADRLPEHLRSWAAPIGAGLGALGGGGIGYGMTRAMVGPASWERKDKKHKDHEKEGHYPGCRSSRKHQARQHRAKKRRVRRKHASAELVDGLMSIIKQAAAEKCGCGCSTCSKCGNSPKQKVRVINGPDIRTNKGHFAWRGRGATSVSDDPTYAHFGTTKAGSLGARAATLVLSLPVAT
jgi:hypothetical protein